MQLSIASNNASTKFSFVTGPGACNVMTILGTGLVGIGNSNPTYLLDVAPGTVAIACSNDASWSNAIAGGSGHGLVITSTKTGTSAYGMGIGIDYASGYGYIQSVGNGTLQPLLLQTRGGNVGIGVSNPTYSLELTANGTIGTMSNLIYYTTGSFSHVFNTGGSNRVHINNTGMYPSIDKSLPCGTTTLKWTNVYSYSATLSCSNNTSHTNAPDGGPGHGIVITSTKTGSTTYSMAMGADFATGFGYINCAGNSSMTPLLLQSRGGYVGIGKSNPSQTLDVAGNATITGVMNIIGSTVTNLYVTNPTMSTMYNNFSIGKSLSLNNTGNLRYYHAADGSTNNYVGLGFWGNDDIITVGASKNITLNGPISVTNGSTGITMSNGNNCFITWLGNSGQIGYWYSGQNSGNAFIVYNNSGVGVYLNYGATSWSGTSDRRLKDNMA
jgi:hypothetical protein